MKKLFLPLFFTLLLAFAIVGCKESPNLTDPENNLNSVNKGGTETLGDPGITIAQGSGYIVAGTGLRNQPGAIDLSGIPNGATVKQVLLYWSGGFDINVHSNGDNTIEVGGKTFMGESIGGPTHFFNLGSKQVYFETFRLDITSEFDWNSTPNLLVQGMDNGALDPNSEPNENDGAGVLVIYDDGSPATIQLVDGQDLVYWNFEGDLKETKEQTFTFPASDKNRTAHLGFLVASCGVDRPNVVRVKLNGYLMPDFPNIFNSKDGGDFDSPKLTINIPPDVSSLSVQLFSEDPNDPNPTGKGPASLNWMTAALSIGEECAPCDGKITQLTLRNDGDAANIEVIQKKPETSVHNAYVPAGGEFSFIGVDKKGTLSTEISIYREGVLDQKIHTSCSQDIFIGSVFGNYTVIDGYSRNGGKLCSTTSGSGGGSDCDVVSEKYKIDKKKLEWEIKNIGDETVTINTIFILWPEGNSLKKIEFNKKIYDQVESWISSGITITQFTGNEKDRELKKNKKETLKFEFTENAAEGPYQIKVVFKEGCELVLDIPAGGNGGGTVCDSKITQTLLKYTGPSIPGPVKIKFEGSSGGQEIYQYGDDGLPSGTELDGGDGYTVSALPGDFGSKFYVYIDFGNGYVLNEVHHTSCSVEYVAGAPAPLNEPKGAPSQNWWVVDFLDKN